MSPIGSCRVEWMQGGMDSDSPGMQWELQRCSVYSWPFGQGWRLDWVLQARLPPGVGAQSVQSPCRVLSSEWAVSCALCGWHGMSSGMQAAGPRPMAPEKVWGPWWWSRDMLCMVKKRGWVIGGLSDQWVVLITSWWPWGHLEDGLTS